MKCDVHSFLSSPLLSSLSAPLGSIFAVGGIGSASVILALRSTMENVIGGLLLKLEDKIRVGEVITVPGDGKKTGAFYALIFKFYFYFSFFVLYLFIHFVCLFIYLVIHLYH